MADVLDNLGDYFKKFDTPIDVHGISKLTQWPMLQSLGHDANLKDLKNNFHGVKDAKIQFNKHALANWRVLAPSWAAIASMLLGNSEIAKLMTNDPVLGAVGKKVTQFPSFGAVFAVKPGQLKGSSLDAYKD